MVSYSSKSSHAKHITPTIYHDEIEDGVKSILSINTEEDKTKQQFPELIDLHDVTFRILLIDDKDGYEKDKNIYNVKESKANLIADLMKGDILEPFVNSTNNIRSKELAKRIALESIENIRSWLEAQKIIEEEYNEEEISKQRELQNKLQAKLNNIAQISEYDVKDLKEKILKKQLEEERVNALMSYLEKREKKIKTDYYIAERLIWKEEHIDCFFFTTDEEKRKEYVNDKYNCFDISKHKTSENVQIIQVTNLADAIILLANESIRFDLILLDYLLGKKEIDPNDRQLSTDFFIWFQDKEGENESVDYLRKQLCEIKNREKGQSAKCPQVNNTQSNNTQTVKCSLCEERQFFLNENKELRQRIKSNRGPLRKLWIFPITAFNETLINDLIRNNVRLIDYYWHICKGVDPITTPYLFLRMLNSFLYLQLQDSVFMEHKIKDFLKKSIKRLKKVDSSEDFIAVMGSDYTEFVQNFMNRSIIYRDKNNNSLFANCIWKHFYTNEKYKNEHILVNYIHRFYHRCAFGGNSEYRKMILFWRDMKLFIENNFPDWVNDNELNLETYYTILNQVYPK